ncbi:molybdenum cofactor synthesis protein cinnamon [Eupeodes corollae]|uniref:molybdenum cofactor synthesis protein cinnamon n=1 Tax=Eupeodes corollae TaxID=290404 RepID=UPI00249236E0|nr:molybdenum cofactor synthesis protein cinnamon [Eupeodes corollae]
MDQPVFVVLTISDSCHQQTAVDKSGPRLKELVKETFGECQFITEILPDERSVISSKLNGYALRNVRAILTTGGTGFGPRDITPEATKDVIQKECPQLVLAMALESLKKTPFGSLSRAVAGILNKTLIVNFPGSEKAVVECFEAIRSVLPHALQLIGDDFNLVQKTHKEIQGSFSRMDRGHVCPHKTGTGDPSDRNSPFPMLPVHEALGIIFRIVVVQRTIPNFLSQYVAPVDIPPFRASIKDGYAMKSSGFSGAKKVVGYIAAGDEISDYELQEDECFKINTGAPIPNHADCVIQIEDTKLLRTTKSGAEDLVEILVDPQANLDIRPIGCDLRKGTQLFPSADHSEVVVKSILASVGKTIQFKKPKIAVISTGSELLAPDDLDVSGKIYDSNTTMIEELLAYFNFECMMKSVLRDDFESLKAAVEDIYQSVDFIICSGGVSMGDKDYIKPVLEKLGFQINFGRINMKPGKPMTFASNTSKGKYFFGLPGNPVSAFVTFHLFALPAVRWASGWERDKCELATIQVTLQNDNIDLDPRPEYVRASVTSKNGRLYASVNGNQISSRLQSIIGADVLIHLPGKTAEKPVASAGDILRASVLRYDFISKYE